MMSAARGRQAGVMSGLTGLVTGLWACSLVWSFACPRAAAQNLNPQISLDTAQTLPQNVRSPRFINIIGSTTDRFTGDGHLEGLGAKLNKSITWNDVLTEQQDNEVRTQLRGSMLKNGVEDSQSPGRTTGEVNTFANVRVAALAWGLTDRLTLAAVLPIVKVDVSASTGFTAPKEGDYSRVTSDLAQSLNPVKAREAQSQFDDAINRKLLRLGYQPIPSSQTISGIGDTQLVSKYKLYDDGVNGIALKGTLVFPTGTAPNADKALDVPTGSGTFGMGLAAVYDAELEGDVRWDNVVSYTAFLPHHIDRRIPTSVEDPLSADKENVYEHARHQLALSTGLDHLIEPLGIIAGMGYSFQFLTRANYEAGQAFDSSRYSLLGDLEPAQALHSWLVSTSFSTIEWYKNKKFPVPFQLNVAYSVPLAGRNAPAGNLLTAELIAFF